MIVSRFVSFGLMFRSFILKSVNREAERTELDNVERRRRPNAEWIRWSRKTRNDTRVAEVRHAVSIMPPGRWSSSSVGISCFEQSRPCPETLCRDQKNGRGESHLVCERWWPPRHTLHFWNCVNWIITNNKSHRVLETAHVLCRVNIYHEEYVNCIRDSGAKSK